MESFLFGPPHVKKIAEELVTFEPSHLRFLLRRFQFTQREEVDLLEDIACRVLLIAGSELSQLVKDYDWTCKMLLQEELFFRKHKRYRYSSFSEARDQVYSDPVFMEKYINGLLISQLLWSNHTAMIKFYKDEYLPMLSVGQRHLEIGPGHGLFLAYACESNKLLKCTAWDLSETSILHTKNALSKMKVHQMPDLYVSDLFHKTTEKYESLVVSEVLEHTEKPREALSAIRRILQPGGFLFVNMPVNSPAPDHLYNPDKPENVCKLIESSGFKVVKYLFSPLTNTSMERARRLSLTISCGVIAMRTN